MNDGSAKLITLGDLFRDGRKLLIQDKPSSPYRYIEFLIEGTLQRKFGLKKVVELGPGSDSGLAYLNLDAADTALAIDYSQGALDAVKAKLGDNKIDYRLVDITVPNVLDDLRGQFDYVICNSVIEHVIDDAALARTMHALLAPGGIVVCTTVLQPGLYNLWDHAVGHYRRYELRRLAALFSDFSEVQVLQTSIAQELSRPLFFNRVRHLEKNTIEQNNRWTAVGHQDWGRVPYAGIWSVVKYAMPLYLVAEWGLNYVTGGIGFVIGRK
jgi:SAM-dependent methyltransferase